MKHLVLPVAALPAFCRFLFGRVFGLSVVAGGGMLVALGLPAATASAGSVAAQKGVDYRTIMPLGDSITERHDSYRYPLMRLLADGGYAVGFVGSKNTEPNPHYAQFGALQHEGHSGKTVQFLAERIRSVYPQHPADIVLIHAGHNQFADQQPVAGVVAATRDIIEYVRSVNPQVTVLLAQVITSGKMPKYSYIPELNAQLAQLAAELDREGQRVLLVDQADGWDWRTDTIADQVHPNTGGGQKMAAKWYAALATVLPAPRSGNAVAASVQP